ncbi:uncharacterized protein LOC111919215 [Lactuca sativa]|uniref:Uncharacterized protein n=1 Tax=Lactuca sativa TaxID=4236 RepID=A0A9R1VB34_LACSA|nr:uncharacterized protein LOC111919215 [Lactuca sativa]KAJ0201563.1 hypothetical protein LSAT_V11C600326970 [Lactuca sativa]
MSQPQLSPPLPLPPHDYPPSPLIVGFHRRFPLLSFSGGSFVDHYVLRYQAVQGTIIMCKKWKGPLSSSFPVDASLRFTNTMPSFNIRKSKPYTHFFISIMFP